MPVQRRAPHRPSRPGSPPLDRQPTRSGFIGKVLLWVIGIPLLVMLFALAAISRGLFSARPDDTRPDPANHPAAPDGRSHAPSPPAIYQPHGPDRQDRSRHGVDL